MWGWNVAKAWPRGHRCRMKNSKKMVFHGVVRPAADGYELAGFRRRTSPG